MEQQVTPKQLLGELQEVREKYTTNDFEVKPGCVDNLVMTLAGVEILSWDLTPTAKQDEPDEFKEATALFRELKYLCSQEYHNLGYRGHFGYNAGK